MFSLALLLLQAASALAPAAAPAPDERLLQPVPPGQCASSGAEIVVCARDQDAYRLKQAGPDVSDETSLPKAEWRLFGGATAGVGTSQRVIGGYPSNAIMATIKIPF